MYNQNFKVENLVNAPSAPRKLRSTNKVKIKNKFTGKAKVFYSPLYRGLRLWDTLPMDVQKEPDTNVFKKIISLHTF